MDLFEFSGLFFENSGLFFNLLLKPWFDIFNPLRVNIVFEFLAKLNLTIFIIYWLEVCCVKPHIILVVHIVEGVSLYIGSRLIQVHLLSFEDFLILRDQNSELLLSGPPWLDDG